MLCQAGTGQLAKQRHSLPNSFPLSSAFSIAAGKMCKSVRETRGLMLDYFYPGFRAHPVVVNVNGLANHSDLLAQIASVASFDRKESSPRKPFNDLAVSLLC